MLLAILAGVLIVSSLRNMYRQYRQLVISEEKVTKLQEKYDESRNKLAKLIQLVEYTTSSAAKERMYRGEMAVGTDEDYLLKLESDE